MKQDWKYEYNEPFLVRTVVLNKTEEIIEFLNNLHLLHVSDRNPNVTDSTDSSLLMYACKNGNLDVVKKLLDLKVNVNHRNNDGLTALMYACINDKLDIVKELLKNKEIDVNHRNNDGMTPLLYACINNKLHIVEELLKNEDIDVNCHDNDGMTSLMYACQENNLNIVTKLLETSSIQINCINKYGLSALMYACAENNRQIVAKLLENPSINIHIKDRGGDGIQQYAGGEVLLQIQKIKNNIGNIQLQNKRKTIKGFINTSKQELQKKRITQIKTSVHAYKPKKVAWFSLVKEGKQDYTWINWLKDNNRTIQKNNIHVVCNAVDYEDCKNLHPCQWVYFQNCILMMKDLTEFKDFTTKYPWFTKQILNDHDKNDNVLIDFDNVSIDYNKLQNYFAGIGIYIVEEDWDVPSFAIWNFDCVLEEEVERKQQQQTKKL